MKKYTLTLTIFAVMLAVLVAGCSQSGVQGSGSDEKVTLALDVQKGQTFKLAMIMDQDIKTKVMGMNNDAHQEMAFYVQYDVVGPKGEGTEMKVTYNRVKYKMESAIMGTLIDYDSDSGEPAGGNPMTAGMAESMGGLIGKSFGIVMSKQGEVVEVTGAEEIYGSVGQDVPPQYQGENLEKTLQGMMAIFPETQIGVGDTWGAESDLSGEFPLKMTTTYKVEGIDATTVYLDVKGEISAEKSEMMEGEGSIEMDGTQGGIMEVDRMTGMVLKAEFTQDITGEVEAGPVQAPMEINSTITIEPYE